MTRDVDWIKAAQRDFQKFPAKVREHIATALNFAAHGQIPDTAKPMKGLGSGVFEIALRHQGDAYRTVYAVQIGDSIWVVHAFQKKSTKGIATPKKEIDLVKSRLKQLREQLK